MFLQRIALALAVIAVSVATTATAQDDPNDYHYVADSGQSALDQSSGDDGCCDLGCDTCGCQSCNSCCSSWTGRVNYVYMWRQRIGSDFAVLEDLSDNPVFNDSQFDFEGKSGIDTSLAWDNGCGRGVEFRYLWVDDFVSDQTMFFAPITRPATNPNTIAGGSGYDWNVRYKSEIQSLELLGRQGCGKIQLTYGFRYVDLDETLGLDAIGSPSNHYSFAAKNNLYGFQLGLDGPLWDNCCGLRVEGFAKAGIYLNDADVSSQRALQHGPIDASGNNNESAAAFVGELGLTASYDVSCWLTLRAGYQLLLLDGVALAADQVSTTGALESGTNVPVSVSKNSLLYHGLHAGLEARW